MLPQLSDEDVIRRELEKSLGLDSVDSGDEIQAELEALDQESEKSHRKRGGVGFQAVKKKRVFCAEEAKLKEVLKSKKGGTEKEKSKHNHPKAVRTPVADSSDEDDVSRLDMIFQALREKKQKRENSLRKRLGTS